VSARLFLFLQKLTDPQATSLPCPSDDFAEYACHFLQLKEEASGKFTQRVSAFFEENLIFNVKTLLTMTTKAFLREGKVLPLWLKVQ
jgi:hypothetical protein